MSSLNASEHSIVTWDGTKLFYRAWQPMKRARRALLLLHRGHEHSGRLESVVEALDLDDVAVFAWDARGHGQSAGARGDAESFAALVKDLDVFARFVACEHEVSLAVMGHSVGAVIAAAWVHDYAPPVRALVLASPAFRIRLYVPGAIPLLRALARVRPGASVRSYVRPSMLTHDPDEAERYASDPLITRDVSVRVLLGVHDTSTRLIADAGAISVPTLVLTAGADWVVDVAAQQRFFEALGSEVKELRSYPGYYHGLLHERGREAPIAAAREFILKAFDEPAPAPGARPRNTDVVERQAPPAGVRPRTTEVSDRLARPLPWWSPRRYAFEALKGLLATVGRLSRGVQVGWRHGFDSGESLDYVYANTPRGVTPLGRWIDRRYLDAVGWRGIRQRRAILQQVLFEQIRDARAGSNPIRVLDIAAGPGRYVLEVLKSLPARRVFAELRDRDAGALETGRRRAAALGLTNVRWAQADAFDEAALAAIRPRPDIAIIAGLYELFPDNDRVLASLRGLRQAVARGGVLIYTNQPWHPQLELIARTLVNRDGRPWVMRCRPQAEMDSLVLAAGFDKIRTEVEDHGIFTVSVARVV